MAAPATSLQLMDIRTPTCHDCYFRRHGLCALALERPCPTFRAAGHALEPPTRPPALLAAKRVGASAAI
jgi:hypothetical protein